ncbi:hypothetical protein DV735_g5960, partial [Chaetothyriales sp. CBS 134920]
MIPWSSFSGADPHYTDEQFPLRQSLLLSNFSATATRISEYEESPMLNNACERRFALSQLNRWGSRFNAEHVNDIESTIEHLLNYYKNHAPFAPRLCRPVSPQRNDLAGLTDTTPSTVEVPALHLNSNSTPPPSPTPTPGRARTPSSSSATSSGSISNIVSTAGIRPPRDRLLISRLVNADSDMSVSDPHRPTPLTQCCLKAIIPESRASPQSDISNQFTSLPPLRLTIDDGQSSATAQPFFSRPGDVNAILSQILPPQVTPSPSSLSSHSLSPISFKPPFLPPRTVTQAVHSRVHRTARKRRHSPSLDPTRRSSSSSKAGRAAKKARRDLPRDAHHPSAKEADSTRWQDKLNLQDTCCELKAS